MKRTRRSSRTRYILLGMLSQKESSGYELQKRIENSTAYFWSESLGQIYPSLEWLEKAGMVTSRTDASTGRKRHLYKISKKGKAEFRSWIGAPYQPTVERNELLLKVFFCGETEPKVALEHLARAKKEALEYRVTLNEIRKALQKTVKEKGRRVFFEATIKAGIIGANAQISWCKEVSRDIETLL